MKTKGGGREVKEPAPRILNLDIRWRLVVCFTTRYSLHWRLQSQVSTCWQIQTQSGNFWILLLPLVPQPSKIFFRLSLSIVNPTGRHWMFNQTEFPGGFSTFCFYRVGLLAPRPTPTLEDQDSVFIPPRGRVAQLYPQAPGTHFSRLLRHEFLDTPSYFPDKRPDGVYVCFVRSPCP
jgi:hypothetical protein